MRAPARRAAACAARSKASTDGPCATPLRRRQSRAPRLTSRVAKTSMPDSWGVRASQRLRVLGGRQAGKAPDFGSGSEGSTPSRPARRNSVLRSVKDEIKIFAGNSNRALANAISLYVGVPLGGAEIGRFSDGEVQVEITDNVRGGDVFVMQSTCTPGNDNLMELLLMLDALKRASAKRLDPNLAIIDKRRARPNEVAEGQTVGQVDGRHAVIIDDIVDTAGTLCAAAEAVRAAGAPAVIACATHPVLSGSAVERLERSTLDELIVTDTIPLGPDAARLPNLRVLSVAPLLGEAIRRTHDEASISPLSI